METPPQTADQINLPQTGKVEVAPPSPERILPSSFRVDSRHPGHVGVKADVIKGIELDPNIKPHWKTALLAEIVEFPGAAIRFHVHVQSGGDYLNATYFIKKMF